MFESLLSSLYKCFIQTLYELKTNVFGVKIVYIDKCKKKRAVSLR